MQVDSITYRSGEEVWRKVVDSHDTTETEN